MTKSLQQSPCPRNLRIIANPASGQGSLPLYPLNRLFREHGIPWDLHLTHAAGDGARLARDLIASGADVIAVYGGDGTVKDVAGGLTGTGVPLLILPGGTGNLVANELGIPRDPVAAAALVAKPAFCTRLIDVGTMSGAHFLLRAGCGVEASVLRDVSPELKKQFGKWAYAIAAVKALQEVPAVHFRITIDDEFLISGSGVGCTVANAGVVGLGGLTLSPGIGIDDGRLDIVFLRKADIEGIFSLAAVMAGVGETLNDVTGLDASHLVGRWQARKVRIETDPILPMQADGDLSGSSPQEIEILPAALRVVVPGPVDSP
ncbi:MAG: diacylglycerol kinase family lipid kinase [Verrucomicrobia bacterium]|nr:diacylglycerol kinase family lipid kinase [Verrucomicrobiota bacterium]